MLGVETGVVGAQKLSWGSKDAAGGSKHTAGA